MAGGLDNFSGSGAIVSGLKNIIHENYLSVLKNYEYIIYSRFDQMYTDYHPKFTGKNIWIPEGEDYFGICDRHSIFSSEYADKFFQICEYFDSDDGLNNAPKHVTPESVFLNHLQSINLGDKIIRIKRFQFTVSEENDATRWRVAKYKLHLYSGLKMKYPDEFIDSISNFLKEHGVLKSIFLQPRMLINFMYLKLRRVLGQIVPNKMKKHLSKNKI